MNYTIIQIPNEAMKIATSESKLQTMEPVNVAFGDIPPLVSLDELCLYKKNMLNPRNTRYNITPTIIIPIAIDFFIAICFI